MECWPDEYSQEAIELIEHQEERIEELEVENKRLREALQTIKKKSHTSVMQSIIAKWKRGEH